VHGLATLAGREVSTQQDGDSLVVDVPADLAGGSFVLEVKA
jgi:hypothetical protein